MDSGSIHSSSSYRPSIDDAEQSLLRGFYREALHVSNELLREVEVSEAGESDLDTAQGYELSFFFRGERVPIVVIESDTTTATDRMVAVALQSWYTLFQRARTDQERERGFPHLRTAFYALESGVSVEVVSIVVQFLFNLNLRQSSLTLAVDVLQLFDGTNKTVSLAEVWEMLLCKLLPYSKDGSVALGLLQALETTTRHDASESTEDESLSPSTNGDNASFAPEDSSLNQLSSISVDSKEGSSVESDDFVSFVARWKYCEQVNDEVLAASIEFASSSATEASLCLPVLKKLQSESGQTHENVGMSQSRAPESPQVPSSLQMPATTRAQMLHEGVNRLVKLLQEAVLDPWLPSSALDPQRNQKRRQIVLSALSFWIFVRQRRKLVLAGKTLILSSMHPFLEIVRALMPSE